MGQEENEINKEPSELEFIGTDEEGRESTKKDREKKLLERFQKCEKERQEYLLGWQRAKADFINARRTEEESRDTLREAVKIDVLTQLLPVIDSFGLAFRDKEARRRGEDNWHRGIEHIYTQLIEILKNNDVEQINPLNALFDPQKHESVELVTVEKKEEDGKIMEVMQKGFEINGRIIRPARVKVGEFKEARAPNA